MNMKRLPCFIATKQAHGQAQGPVPGDEIGSRGDIPQYINYSTVKELEPRHPNCENISEKMLRLVSSD